MKSDEDSKITDLIVSVAKLQTDLKYIMKGVDQSKKQWQNYNKLEIGVSHYIENSSVKLKQINDDITSIKKNVLQNNEAYEKMSHEIKWIKFELKVIKISAIVVFLLCLLIQAQYIRFHIDADKILPLLSVYIIDCFNMFNQVT